MFEKNLLLLIPFYIFSHESRFEEYEKDKTKLWKLQEEYGHIKNNLEELLNQGIISEYTRCTIIDMSNKVLEHIAVKYDSVRNCLEITCASYAEFFFGSVSQKSGA